MTLKTSTKKTTTNAPARKAGNAKPSPARAASKPARVTPPAALAAADDTRPVTFHYFAPQAGAVWLAGDFTQWESSPVKLQREDNGMWSATVKLTPGRHEYRLLVDGQWQNDPQCGELRPNQFGSTNCVCAVTA